MKRRMCVTCVWVCVGVQVGCAIAARHCGPDKEEQTTNPVRHSRGLAASACQRCCSPRSNVSQNVAVSLTWRQKRCDTHTHTHAIQSCETADKMEDGPLRGFFGKDDPQKGLALTQGR